MRKLLGAGGTYASSQSKAPSNVPSAMNPLSENLEPPTSVAGRRTSIPFSQVGKAAKTSMPNAYSKKTGFATVSKGSSKTKAC